ncbi:MAG TPA: carboxypeptidase regulatory-like domain-containing protein [Candidatus Krumholzibacteria bacterium]|nr:carboxypeptidase regulatory-like domain-containing protein [Candidatus Krumholzibacteria bacterium]
MKYLSALGCVLILLMSVATAGAGELKGVVTLTGVKTPTDAVVYIDAIPDKTFPAPEAHAEMDQKNLVFTPHVLPVLVGTTVDFVNSDAVLHNVFSPDKCCEQFNLGSWPQGQKRSYTFKSLCRATLLCKVHPEMEGFIVVVPTPYFAVTDKTGAYSIKDVPDGTYTVKVWHEKFKKEYSGSVKVAGETTSDITMTK